MGSSSTRTPEFSDVVRTLIEEQLVDMNICMPGKVTAYDPSTQYADVEVQLLQSYIDGTTKPFPVIPKVPVKHPRSQGGKAFIHMPIAVGDDVILVFSQRSLDNWKTQGGMSNPDDLRMHHLTDAYALIGGSAIPDAFAVDDPKSITIVNGESTLLVNPDGTFALKNQTVELIDLLDQLLQQLQVAQTSAGPFLPDTLTQFAQLQEQLDTLKGS